MRSLRGRVTLITTVAAASVLIPAGVGGVAVAKAVIEAGVWNATRETAARTSAEVREYGLPPGDLKVTNPHVDLIQVVKPGPRVVAASDAAESLPPLSDVWPTQRDRVVDTTSCSNGTCRHVTAVRMSLSPDSAVVYAAESSPKVLSSQVLDAVVLGQVAVLVGLASWATWLVTGRALRPVKAIRAELDEVNISDLSRRVTQPRGEDEVAGLAASINSTLARLERSAEQQRQFASDASHELRTPIAGLRTQLESAQLYPEDTDVRELADGALRDTDRLEAIITDLLLLARIGSRVDMAKERVDLAELVRQEISRRRDRVPVEPELGEGVVVDGVRLQLARLVANVLDNAVRYAESGVTLDLSAHEGQAVLVVENDGAEIPEEDRERIFERFTRLDAARSREAGGTGLGLAIARAIALAHMGTIAVEDRTGGARFVLRLPLAP
ncbi:HAMP domain-containing sensor histidine kinase [Nonomuraea longicatena]|uniref:histidine kinase n=1 Tax=Nonomuraea longicatena TaxID=83682 RepID=A0ABN1QL30_9ACTN